MQRNDGGNSSFPWSSLVSRIENNESFKKDQHFFISFFFPRLYINFSGEDTLEAMHFAIIPGSSPVSCPLSSSLLLFVLYVPNASQMVSRSSQTSEHRTYKQEQYLHLLR